MSRGAGLLVRVALGMAEVPPVVPSHLRDRAWRFLCECGVTWRVDKADAEARRGQVQPPRRCCTSCHTWVDGRLMDSI